MRRSLDLFTAALFMLLSGSVLMAWSFIAPQMWTELDLRVALASLALTWLGVAWVLSRRDLSSDPLPAQSRT